MSLHDVVAYSAITFMAMSVGYQLYEGWCLLRNRIRAREVLEDNYLLPEDDSF